MKFTVGDGQADEQSGKADAAVILLQQFDVVCDLADQAFEEIERAEKLLEQPDIGKANIQDCLRSAALKLLALKTWCP